VVKMKFCIVINDYRDADDCSVGPPMKGQADSTTAETSVTVFVLNMITALEFPCPPGQ